MLQDMDTVVGASADNGGAGAGYVDSKVLASKIGGGVTVRQVEEAVAKHPERFESVTSGASSAGAAAGAGTELKWEVLLALLLEQGADKQFRVPRTVPKGVTRTGLRGSGVATEVATEVAEWIRLDHLQVCTVATVHTTCQHSSPSAPCSYPCPLYAITQEKLVQAGYADISEDELLNLATVRAALQSCGVGKSGLAVLQSG
jgi:hypothetical protein